MLKNGDILRWNKNHDSIIVQPTIYLYKYSLFIYYM